MESKRYLILGNGIAGSTAAEEIRSRDSNSIVTILANEVHPLYNRVALPRYLGGQVKESDVFLRSKDFYKENNIEIHFDTRATNIDTHEKLVYSDKMGTFPYDSLLLAMGGHPQTPPWAKDIDLPLHQFHTIDNANEIIDAAEKAHKILVIGGSFIAYEICEAMVKRNKDVTWLMRGPRFLRYVLDELGGEVCRKMGEEQGVRFLIEDEIQELHLNGNKKAITAKCQTIEFDMLAGGLGLKFNTESVIHSEIGVMGGIVTDSYLQTNVPDVYAAGDIAVFFDERLQKHSQMGTWDNALAMGKCVAQNMLGQKEVFFDVPTYTTTMFGSTMAVMGTTPDVDVEMDSVIDASLEEKYYRKLFFKDNVLKGAVMIGSPKGRKKLIELIRKGELISKKKEDYLDIANL